MNTMTRLQLAAMSALAIFSLLFVPAPGLAQDDTATDDEDAATEPAQDDAGHGHHAMGDEADGDETTESADEDGDDTTEEADEGSAAATDTDDTDDTDDEEEAADEEEEDFSRYDDDDDEGGDFSRYDDDDDDEGGDFSRYDDDDDAYDDDDDDGGGGGGGGSPAAPVVSGIDTPGGAMVLGAGLAIAIVGAVTGSYVVNQNSRLDAECPGGVCPDELQSTRDATDNLAITTGVLLGTGGAVAITGIILWAVLGGDDDVDDSEPEVTAGCGMSGCSVGLSGVF